MDKAKRLQEQYYQRMADCYDDMHLARDDEHYVALKYVSELSRLYGIQSFLDVGCGTGRALKFLLDAGFVARGIEPIEDLIEQAVKKGIRRDLISTGNGEQLPFEDNSFDAVCEFGVLHHVRRPSLVVNEMMRVGRKVVFLSDSNRFGQGSKLERWIKLFLYKAGLWGIANWAKTKGKGFTQSEGDGISYSYSVYDSYRQLAAWSDKTILVPTVKAHSTSWFHPLLTSPHVLLCAVRTDAC